MIDLNDYLDPRSREVHDKVLRIKEWMIDEKCTIRQASKELLIPPSTIHYYIHNYIKEYYPEDYYSLQKILRFNKIYRSKRRSSWRS